mmetsp:Transcript_79854/g.191718  ORF Transcript_79854/g.191718 Transcript_79854/m.191718 type:complete len:224 (-) Transcript_79854:818-1489(-)
MPQPRNVDTVRDAVHLHQAIRKLAYIYVAFVLKVNELPNLVQAHLIEVNPKILEANLHAEVLQGTLKLLPFDAATSITVGLSKQSLYLLDPSLAVLYLLEHHVLFILKCHCSRAVHEDTRHNVENAKHGQGHVEREHRGEQRVHRHQRRRQLPPADAPGDSQEQREAGCCQRREGRKAGEFQWATWKVLGVLFQVLPHELQDADRSNVDDEEKKDQRPHQSFE